MHFDLDEHKTIAFGYEIEILMWLSGFSWGSQEQTIIFLFTLVLSKLSADFVD